MAQWGKLTYAQKRCLGEAGRVMQTTNMIWPGARIGVAASGGMDSWVLLQVLLMRQRIVPFPFEIMVLHVNPGFDEGNHVPLVGWAEARGLAIHAAVSAHGPEAHGPENRKRSPCFYCSMRRRKWLFDRCREYGLTHLAFGHNADDLVQNFFLNLVRTGRVDGMSIGEWFFGRELLVIRPLLLVEKRYIRPAAKSWNLPIWSNPCPSAASTARKEMVERVQDLTRGDRRMMKNIVNGLRRWQLDLTGALS
ncbi:MAG: tRNA 2-thiocytidine biosynthesis protein TtcA [Deltaproteobacteria bacterium]|nr:tRNA 2-thiocytidine biosynthesis protein TtcA [Deltaproteobacteria bacterium]